MKRRARSRPKRWRLCPPDFARVYLDIGWQGIEDHYGAHKLTIKRWIEEAGGVKLRQARARVVKNRRARLKAQGRSCMGIWNPDLSAKPPPEVLDELAGFPPAVISTPET